MTDLLDYSSRLDFRCCETFGMIELIVRLITIQVLSTAAQIMFMKTPDSIVKWTIKPVCTGMAFLWTRDSICIDS